jgi:hypothetical protein
MKSIETRINQYLECESVLNEFFKELTFCYEDCLTQEHSLFLKDIPGCLGCCPDNQYEQSVFPFKWMLDMKRDEKYSKPGMNYEACDYHTMDGCILEDHKPPACLAYICPDFRDYLLKEHGIAYNRDNIRTFLKNILEGKIDQEDISRFKFQIKISINKLKKPVRFKKTSKTRL